MRRSAEYQEPNVFDLPVPHKLSNLMMWNRVESADGEIITPIKLCYECREKSRLLEAPDEFLELVKSLIGKWVLVDEEEGCLSVTEYHPEKGWKTK